MWSNKDLNNLKATGNSVFIECSFYTYIMINVFFRKNSIGIVFVKVIGIGRLAFLNDRSISSTTSLQFI